MTSWPKSLKEINPQPIQFLICLPNVLPCRLPHLSQPMATPTFQLLWPKIWNHPCLFPLYHPMLRHWGEALDLIPELSRVPCLHQPLMSHLDYYYRLLITLPAFSPCPLPSPLNPTANCPFKAWHWLCHVSAHTLALFSIWVINKSHMVIESKRPAMIRHPTACPWLCPWAHLLQLLPSLLCH